MFYKFVRDYIVILNIFTVCFNKKESLASLNWERHVTCFVEKVNLEDTRRGALTTAPLALCVSSVSQGSFCCSIFQRFKKVLTSWLRFVMVFYSGAITKLAPPEPHHPIFIILMSTLVWFYLFAWSASDCLLWCMVQFLKLYVDRDETEYYLCVHCAWLLI